MYRLRIDGPPLPTIEIRGRLQNGVFDDLLFYRRLIAGAAEVHCINSSVIHLVDSLDLTARLFYHDVRLRNFQLRHNWTVVPYRWRGARRLLVRIAR